MLDEICYQIPHPQRYSYYLFVVTGNSQGKLNTEQNWLRASGKTFYVPKCHLFKLQTTAEMPENIQEAYNVFFKGTLYCKFGF